MSLIEKTSNIIGLKLAASLNMDKDSEEIISYGAFSLIQTIVTILWVVIIGKLFGVLYEAIIITFTISTLRKSSGGAHATSPARCAIIGTVISVGMALLIKSILSFFNIYRVVFLGIISFLFSYYTIYKLAPVDSPSKRINKPERRSHLKKLSLITINIFLAAIIIMIFIYTKYDRKFLLSYIQCIYLGIFWQTFTLTFKGHQLLNKIDSLLKKICNRR